MRRNWPREGRQPVRDAGGFGPRPARGGGGQIRPNSERINCVPHGAIYATSVVFLRTQKSDTRIFAFVRANSTAIREARFARRVGPVRVAYAS